MKPKDSPLIKIEKPRPQTFCFTSPTAMSVQLVGDFTRWQKDAVSLKKREHGVWTTTVPLAPGTYHYRFIVDGDWRDDPECTLRVANPFGSQDSIRCVT